MIAALYVQKGGVYYGLDDVDPWDEERDARLYAGPWPVVAHPPCNRWNIMADLNESLYGHKVGDDGGSFAHALWAVETFGGVLEHPAMSRAWLWFGLPMPARYGWAQCFDRPGATTEVSQVAYGHVARKRTWLYASLPAYPALDWREPEASAIVSDLGATKNGKRWEDAGERVQYDAASRTPPAFRDVLLSMARSALDRERPEDIASAKP